MRMNANAHDSGYAELVPTHFGHMDKIKNYALAMHVLYIIRSLINVFTTIIGMLLILILEIGIVQFRKNLYTHL